MLKNHEFNDFLKNAYFLKLPYKGIKQVLNVGSLFKMLQSEYFDIHMLISYLFLKKETGIQDALINLMSLKYIDKSYFYIPQLCMLMSTKESYNSIETYILDRCVDRLKFSIKTFWIISSFSPKSSSIFEQFLSKIEMTLINGRRSTLSSYKSYRTELSRINTPNDLSTKEVSDLLEKSKSKETNLNYFDNIIRFYYELKLMCEKLNNFPKESENKRVDTRQSVLGAYINNFNYKLSVQSKEYYNGIILPFDDYYSINDEYNTIIVNFIPEHCQCFSTKARVPVKLTVETVKLIESKDWESKIIKEKYKNWTELKLISNENDIKEFKSVEDFLVNYDSFQQKEENLTHNDIWHLSNNSENVNHTNSNDFTLLNNNDAPLIEVKKIVEEIAIDNKYHNHNNKEVIRRLNESVLFDVEDQDLINPFDKLWNQTCIEIKENSPFKNFSTYI